MWLSFIIVSVRSSNSAAQIFHWKFPIPIVFSSPSNNFSLHAAMNVTRFSCVLKHGRTNARLIFLLFFFFLSKLHADRYEATTEISSRQQWPWESAWTNRGAEHFSPHSSIIHLRPSPLVRSSSIPPSAFAPPLAIRAHSFEFQASPRGIRETRHRTSSRARAVYSIDSTCTPISNLDAYPRPRVLHVRTDHLASAERGRGIIASVILN